MAMDDDGVIAIFVWGVVASNLLWEVNWWRRVILR